MFLAGAISAAEVVTLERTILQLLDWDVCIVNADAELDVVAKHTHQYPEWKHAVQALRTVPTSAPRSPECLGIRTCGGTL